MKKVILLLAVFLVGVFTYAQNTGDVCVIGMNSDNPDEVLLVTFTDISSGTVIYLTDNEWDSTAWTTGEGFKSFTLTQDWLAGQVVLLDLTNNTAEPDLGTVKGESGSLALSTSGDQLYVYTGSDYSTPTTFLFAINTTGGWNDGELYNTGLEDSVTALSFPNSTDDIEYSGLRIGKTSYDGYKSLIADVANNWTISGSAFSFDLSEFSLASDNPNKFVISKVSPNPTYLGWNFKVIVQAVDTSTGKIGVVSKDTKFTFAINGTGNLSLDSGLIPEGSFVDTLILSYDAAEAFKMVAKFKSGDTLAASDSALVTVKPSPKISSFPDSIVFNDTTTLFDLGIYTMASKDNWEVGNYDGEYFLELGSLNDTAWAILPKIVGAQNLGMSFWSKAQNAGSELRVLVSTDYQGYGDPENATWTDITSNFTLSGGSWEGVNSGQVNLTKLVNASDFYVAFEFVENQGKYNTWQIDSIALAPVVIPTRLVITNVSPNPTYLGWNFKVTVQAQDDNGIPGNVEGDKQIKLNLDDQSVTLSNNTAVIPDGNNSITFDVSIDKVGTYNITAEDVTEKSLTAFEPVSVTIEPLPVITDFPDTIFVADAESLIDLGIYSYSVTENHYWNVTKYGLAVSNYPAKDQTEAWAILPKISSDKALNLSFTNASYGGNSDNSLSILVSTDYQGYGDPNQANWTDITNNFTLSSGGFSVTNSGNVSLAQFGTDYYVAFKFVQPAGSSNTWDIDSIAFAPATATAVEDIANSQLVVYPNPVSSVLYVNAQQGTLQILDNAGRLVKTVEVRGNGEVNVSDLTSGVYFARLRTKDQTLVSKFIKR